MLRINRKLIAVFCFPADVKRVWGFEGLLRASVSRVKQHDLWRFNVALYANRWGLFVALCLVDMKRDYSLRLHLCLNRGLHQMCHFRSRICDIETRAPSHRLDKPHGLDARSERDRQTLGTQLWFWDTFSPWESFSFDYKSTHLLTLAEQSYVQH